MIPPLCFITDASAPASVIVQARAAAQGGAQWIQLRDKSTPDADLAPLARTLMEALSPFGAKLIVNDRVDLAIAIGAPGIAASRFATCDARSRAFFFAGRVQSPGISALASEPQWNASARTSPIGEQAR